MYIQCTVCIYSAQYVQIVPPSVEIRLTNNQYFKGSTMNVGPVSKMRQISSHCHINGPQFCHLEVPLLKGKWHHTHVLHSHSMLHIATIILTVKLVLCYSGIGSKTLPSCDPPAHTRVAAVTAGHSSELCGLWQALYGNSIENTTRIAKPILETDYQFTVSKMSPLLLFINSCFTIHSKLRN